MIRSLMELTIYYCPLYFKIGVISVIVLMASFWITGYFKKKRKEG